MNPGGRSNPCGEKEQDKDEAERPNNLCGEKEQDRDESAQKKPSLRHKKVSWGCI